jgi:hypothetical protein
MAHLRSTRVPAVALMVAVFLTSLPAQTSNATPSNVVIAPGYSMTAVATGLNFPTALTFYGDTIWVTEAGIGAPPAVKQIDAEGNVTTRLTATMLPGGTLVGPQTGIVFARGWFWLVHRQTNASGVPVGAISRFRASNPAGTFQTVLSGLPSFGDHPASQIVFGHGRAYFNVAAPTNSGVVGPDNGWAVSFRALHDFPAVDIELSGIGYQTLIPFPPLDPSATKITEPFAAFGGGVVPTGTVVPATTPAHPQNGIIVGSGAVYSFEPDDEDQLSTIRLEGWGLRTPYGIGFDPFDPDLLFVSNNGADVRQKVVNGKLTIDGSRPIDNDWDDMFVIDTRRERPPFFGHPDYFHDPVTRQPLPVTNPLFCPAGFAKCAQFAFSDAFRSTLTVEPAFAELELHSSANMFDFSRTEAFGFKRDIFIAETGSIPPGTGATSLTGYKVARIDRTTHEVTDFITHPANTQAVIFAVDGFNKPIDVKFRGPEMLVVDFGVFPPAPLTPNSGKIWKVTHDED